MRKLSIILSMLVLVMASNAMALGPLLVFDPATSTPYAWPGAVTIYTDNDPMFSLTGPVSNADGDARVADAAAAWTGVATASLTAAVGGDFASVGLQRLPAGHSRWDSDHRQDRRIDHRSRFDWFRRCDARPGVRHERESLRGQGWRPGRQQPDTHQSVNGSGTLVGPTGVNGLSGMASWVEVVVPTALQSFDAIAGEDVVNLQWKVSVSGGDLLGFRVHRRDPNGTYDVLHDVDLAASARSFSDDTVVPGKAYVYRLEIIDDGRTFFSPEAEVTVKTLTMALAQNNPNPFNPTTTIGYTVPARGKVSLQIYDVTGRYVATLVEEARDAGRYSAVWNGRGASGEQVGSGVYFYRLQVGNQSLTKKMVLLK